MKRLSNSRGRTLRVLTAACLGLALSATATADKVSKDSDPKQPGHVDFNGMKIAIDPATGKLRPLSAAEEAQLNKLMARSRASTDVANVPVVTVGNGMRTATVPESLYSTVTATLNEDGSVTIGHTEGAPEEHEHE